MHQAKARLNWILIGSVVGGLFILWLAISFVHGLQMKRHEETIRSQVAQAEADNQPEAAIEALERYLTLSPGHAQSLAKLGQLLDRTADSPFGWFRALMVNEKVLSRDVGNRALRRRVAELALKLDDYETAHDHLAQLRRAQPEDAEVAARLGDVLVLAGKPEEAIQAYRDSIKSQPKQTLAYARLARIYLQQNQRVLAENVIADMVQAQPDSAGALLERGAFLRQLGRTEPAIQDFNRARQLDPKSPAPLQALTELALTRSRYDEARQLLDQGVKEFPQQRVWYRYGAEMALLQGKPDEALRWIESGLKITPEDVDLWYLRIEASKQKKDAATARADLERLRQLPQAPPGLADLLQGRLLLQQGETAQAAEQFQKLLSDARLPGWIRARAALNLAETAGIQGNPERQAVELRRAVRMDPSLRLANVSLGRTLLQQGKTEEARELLLRLTREGEPPAEAFLALAQASLFHQLGLPETQRDWSEPLRALQNIEQMPEFQVEAALVRADVLVAQGKPGEAETILARTTAEHPTEARAWAARVALARRQGDPARARELEAEGLKTAGDPAVLRLATLAAGDRATAAEIRAAQEDLESRWSSLPHGTRIAYLQTLGSRDPETAARKLAELQPAEGRTLLLALEFALLGREAALVEKILRALTDLEGENSPNVRFGRAAWQVRTARSLRPEVLNAARPILLEAARERPGWSAPLTWLGRLEDQLGHPTEAAKYFRQAFDLGDRSPALCLRLLELLLERDEVEAANTVYRRMERVLLPTGDLARLGAEIARRKLESTRALRLAELARPTGPANPEYLLWHAAFLSRAGELPAALLAVREAVRLDPINPDGWVLWVDLLVKNGRFNEAESVLTQIRERQPRDLQAVTLAQCEAALGRVAQAARYFEQALQRDGRDPYTLWQALSFSLAQKDATQAEALLQRLRVAAPGWPEDRLRWAEEQLAGIK